MAGGGIQSCTRVINNVMDWARCVSSSLLSSDLRVNVVLDGGLRLSQLSALSLLEMSSSESLGVESREPPSTSSYLRLRLRDELASMET